MSKNVNNGVIKDPPIEETVLAVIAILVNTMKNVQLRFDEHSNSRGDSELGCHLRVNPFCKSFLS